MDNKKGFTLIELLAVIVILAIIALIATPLILGVIEESKMNTLRISAYNTIKAGEIYSFQKNKEVNRILENDEITLHIKDLSSDDKNVNPLNLNGKKPDKGYLVMYKNSGPLIVMISGNYCATNKKDSDKVEVIKKNFKGYQECIDLSESEAPEITPEPEEPEEPYVMPKEEELCGLDFVVLDDTSINYDVNKQLITLLPMTNNGVPVSNIIIPSSFSGGEIKGIMERGLNGFTTSTASVCIRFDKKLSVLSRNPMMNDVLSIKLYKNLLTGMDFTYTDSNSIEHVEFGDDIITIGASEGGNSKFFPVKYVTIPASLISIRSDFFVKESLEEIYIYGDCTRFDNEFNEFNDIFGSATKKCMK